MASPLASLRSLVSETTPADRIVSIGLIALSLILAAGLRSPASSPREARVTVDGREAVTLSLASDRRVVVEGLRGPVTLEVREGAVRVVESPCPQRICVAMGERRRTGELIACVPNALVIVLGGGPPDADVPDAVTR